MQPMIEEECFCSNSYHIEQSSGDIHTCLDGAPNGVMKLLDISDNIAHGTFMMKQSPYSEVMSERWQF